jgi:hypothetical protein
MEQDEQPITVHVAGKAVSVWPRVSVRTTQRPSLGEAGPEGRAHLSSACDPCLGSWPSCAIISMRLEKVLAKARTVRAFAHLSSAEVSLGDFG